MDEREKRFLERWAAMSDDQRAAMLERLEGAVAQQSLALDLAAMAEQLDAGQVAALLDHAAGLVGGGCISSLPVVA